MRSLTRWALAALLGGAVAFLISCGDQSGLLSSGQASSLRGELDAVSAAVAAGRCADAESAGQGLGDAIVGLPDDVDARLRSKLKEGAARISAKAGRECVNPTTAPEITTTTPTDTTTTETTPAPPTSTTTATSPETTPPPPPPPPGETTPGGPGTTTPGGGSGGSGGAGPTS